METAYEAFTLINDKIIDEDTGMDALLASATEIENNIKITKTNADSNLSSISTALTSVQANIKEMETAYEAFTLINDKIIDEDTGMDALLASATELKSEIVAVKSNADTLYKEIRKFRDDVATYSKEIENLKITAVDTVGEIQVQHDASVELKNKIDEMFNIGSKGIHSNHFVQRRNQLKWTSLGWLLLFLLFLIATVRLAVVYMLPLADSLKDPTIRIGLEVFILRFSIITPTLFGALYSLKQFSNDRRLYEKYAFKAISTYSAEASVATLSRSLENHVGNDKDAKIINFAINIFTNIYQEPIEPVNDRWTLRGGNKLFNLTAEVNQSVGEIKKDVDTLVDNISQ
jgi:predicted  nucleic acid-binding Zn-ribbon protein